jgi:hypothetical protein
MKTALTYFLLLGSYLLHAQVSVKDYGAKGDGYTDDGKAIQAALHSGKSPVYFEAGKTYRTSITLTVPSNVTVIGNKAILKPNSSFPKVSDIPVITTDNNQLTYSASSSIYVQKGYTTFSYGKAAYLKVGALVLLSGPTYVASYQYGWYGKIVSISGSTVTLSNPATQSFTASTLVQYKISNNVHIKSLFVNLKGRTLGCGIRLKNATNSTVEYCFVESDPTTTSAELGINVTGVNLGVLYNKVRNIRLANDGVGYGISVSGHNITVKGNDVAVARHCITSPGRTYMSTNILYLKNIVNSGAGSAPLDLHGNASGKIDSNTVTCTTPSTTGILVRNKNTVVTNNTITVYNLTGADVYGIAIQENATDAITITKNKVYYKSNYSGISAFANFATSGVINNLRISGNYFQGRIKLTDSIGTNIHIDSNKFEGNTIFYACVNLEYCIIKEFYIQGNTFINNFGDAYNFTVSTGKYTGSKGYIRNNITYCKNLSNKAPQFKLYNKYNILENNKFYTLASAPIADYSTEKQNWMNSNNKAVDNVGNTALITYKALPKATSWFYGRTIAFSDSYGKISYYKCVKTGDTIYAWQKQSNSIIT